LPFWLCPEQVAVAPVSSDQLDYARTVVDELEAAGVRCVLEPPDETLARRIVAVLERGIPIFATVGAKEVAAGTVTLRERDGRRSVHPLSAAVEWLRSLEDSQLPQISHGGA